MGTLQKKSPKGVLRWFLRAPIWLYHAGLGFLLGERFLMFRHIGRKTGLPRETVVEIVTHDPRLDRYYIASGWGEHADWLRNIEKTPEVFVQTGRRKFKGMSRRLHGEEGTLALLEYAQEHPFAFRTLAKNMMGEALTADRSGCETLAARIPIVAIDPIREVEQSGRMR